MKLRLLITLFAIISVALRAVSTDPQPGTLTIDEARNSITSEEFKEHIAFLADDKMKGRDTPSPELLKTAEYIAGQFRKSGLESPEGIENYMYWWEYMGEKVPNIIGIIRGKSDKYIVIGGHMDHVGENSEGIHNGADDNASGTTGVLELAEAFGSLKEAPYHNLVFMTFSGEEKGLLGSRAYVNNPVFPNEKTIAMINLDMIGRSDTENGRHYLFIGGVGTAEEWNDIISKHIKKYSFNLETSPGGRAPSDNSSFFAKGIPCLFFFTNLHEDYHGTTDTYEKINSAASQEIARLVFDVTYEIAYSQSAQLTFVNNGAMALPADFRSRMPRRLMGGMRNRNYKRLGIYNGPELDAEKLSELGLSETEGALIVNKVEKNSVAEKAGIKSGDIIIQFNNLPLPRKNTHRALVQFIQKAKRGEPVPILVSRDGKTIELEAVWKAEK